MLGPSGKTSLLTGLSSSGFTIASSGISRSSGLLLLIFQQNNL
ncbi:MAG TPA: hypothetical protein VFM28_08980 [Nitrososphaeraceae archaeon]|nr:hypothetical protein [Nitrososphaeraceae archaeon]